MLGNDLFCITYDHLIKSMMQKLPICDCYSQQLCIHWNAAHSAHKCKELAHCNACKLWLTRWDGLITVPQSTVVDKRGCKYVCRPICSVQMPPQGTKFYVILTNGKKHITNFCANYCYYDGADQVSKLCSSKNACHLAGLTNDQGRHCHVTVMASAMHAPEIQCNAVQCRRWQEQ